MRGIQGAIKASKLTVILLSNYLTADRTQTGETVDCGPSLLQCPNVDGVARCGSSCHDYSLPFLYTWIGLSLRVVVPPAHVGGIMDELISHGDAEA